MLLPVTINENMFSSKCSHSHLSAAPSAPRNVTASDVKKDQFTVSWDAPDFDGGSKIIQYIVMMKDTTSKKFRKIGKVDGNTLTFQVTTDVEEGKEYLIQVGSVLVLMDLLQLDYKLSFEGRICPVLHMSLSNSTKF